jgi:hypothetical protein
VSCGVEAALADLPQSRKWWLQCQTCKQDWTGRMLRGLANERFKLANHRYRRNNVAPKDLEWTHAAQQLMHSLRQTGEAAALLELAERTLVETRSSFGVDHPETLQVQVRLANAYADTRAYAEAIPLFLSLLKTLRHLPASEFAFGLLCGTASSLSDLFSTMGHYGPALPLAEETHGQAARNLRGRLRIDLALDAQLGVSLQPHVFSRILRTFRAALERECTAKATRAREQAPGHLARARWLGRVSAGYR